MTQRNSLKHRLAPVFKGELISHGRSRGFRGPFPHLRLTYSLTLNKSTLFHSQYFTCLMSIYLLAFGTHCHLTVSFSSENVASQSF